MRPHSYLLNEKTKDSASKTEENSEIHKNETPSNGALNQIEGKNATSLFYDKPWYNLISITAFLSICLNL